MTARRFASEHRFAIVLLGATAIALSPGLFGGFVWDDWPLIVRNTFARDPAHLPHVLTRPFWDVSSRGGVGRLAYLNLYRPFISVAYVTQFHIFGERALGYHAVSLALHVACVLLGLAWLRQRLPSTSPRGALVAGLVPFALHPSRPEVVTWISGCTDLWMTFWALLGVLAIGQPRALTRALGGVCIALAVFSKEAAVVVPVLLALDAWLLEGRRPSLGKEGWAFGGAAVATAVHVIMVPPVTGGASELNDVVSRVAATLGHFLLRTIAFWDPSIEPVPRAEDASGDAVFALQAILVGLALVFGIGALAFLALRRRLALRPWLADALWYLVPLLPVANLVGLSGPTLVADRYLYLPLLGTAALLARGLSRPLSPRRRAAAGVGVTLVGLAMIGVTVPHVLRFRSDADLWAHELARNPSSLNGLRSAAGEALREGRPAAALALFDRGRRAADARHDENMSAVFSLRMVSVLLQRTPDASQDRLRAIRRAYDVFAAEPRLRLALPELDVDRRVDDEAWQDLHDSAELVAVPRAMAYARTGAVAEAEAQLLRLLDERPREAGAWSLLVTVLARQGRWADARTAQIESARRLPGDPSVEAMGRTLARVYALATRAVDGPITVALRDARVQAQLGSPEGARAILERALVGHPQHPALTLELVRTDVSDLRFDLARERIEQAIVADPEHREQWERALDKLVAAERKREAADALALGPA